MSQFWERVVFQNHLVVSQNWRKNSFSVDLYIEYCVANRILGRLFLYRSLETPEKNKEDILPLRILSALSIFSFFSPFFFGQAFGTAAWTNLPTASRCDTEWRPTRNPAQSGTAASFNVSCPNSSSTITWQKALKRVSHTPSLRYNHVQKTSRWFSTFFCRVETAGRGRNRHEGTW